MSLKLPQVFSKKMYIVGRIFDYMPNDIYIDLWTNPPSKEFFLIKEIEIMEDLSSLELDPVTLQVTALRAEIKSIQAIAQNEITKKESEINRLLQLEYIEAQ